LKSAGLGESAGIKPATPILTINARGVHNAMQHLTSPHNRAAFGAGPLQDAGIGLSATFGLTAVAVVVMGGLSFVVAARRPAPSSTSG
jgi:hypothetical protein